MYATLDRMDVIVEEGGLRVAVQTDHREPAEIDADFDRSAIFAISRALNPVRTGSADKVRFAHLHRPSAAYLALLVALGVEVEVLSEAVAPARPVDDAEVDRVARVSLERIGQALLTDLGCFPDEAGLVAAQVACRNKAFAMGDGPDEDPVGYFEALVELGAVTGLVLQTRGAYEWTRDPGYYGVVPFMMGVRGTLTNVFGKVERFFDQGERQAPEHLLRIAEESADVDASPVFFNLRPHDWAGIGRAWTRPLLERDADAEIETPLPVVALVRDMPSSVASIPADTPPDEIGALLAEAEANLGTVPVEIERVDGDLPLLVVHGSYYAAEKILDAAFMANLAGQLRSPLVMAAIPAKGRLLLASALTDPARAVALKLLAERDYDEAPVADRLTPELLLWGEGRILGFARLTSGDAHDAVDASEV